MVWFYAGKKPTVLLLVLVMVVAAVVQLSLAIRRLITIPFATTQEQQLCVTSSASILPAGSWSTRMIRPPGKYRAGYWSMCWDAAGIARRNLSAMTCLWPPCSGATLLAVQVATAMGNRSSAIAYLSGVEAADAAIQNAHRYANLLNIPVRQNDGAFLVLVDHEAEVRTKTSLGGSIIFTSADSGVNEIRWGPLRLLDPTAPEPKRMFNIKGKERIELTPAELATFNTSYSQYLKKALTICRIRNCILITAGCSMRFLMKWRFTETETGITLVTGFYTAISPVLVEMAR